MIEAVIFDLDGLIVDTEIIESRAFEKLLRESGKKPQVKTNGLIHEIGGANLVDYYLKIKQKYNLNDSLLEIQARKRAYFEQIIKEGKIKPYDGFFELIEKLKKSHLRLAVASNRPLKHIRLILRELHALELFEFIVGPDTKRKHKPEPDTYLETAKLLRINPANCLALEDTAKGINAAKSAGMKVIAVPNVYTKEHDFSRADIVVASLKEVALELITSLETN